MTGRRAQPGTGRAARTRTVATGLVLLSAALHASRSPAQGRQATSPRADFVPGFLPAHHWTRDVLAHLFAQGALEAGEGPVISPLSRDVARALLARAAGQPATGTGSSQSQKASALLDRFSDEFHRIPAAGRLIVSASTGWTRASGDLRTGRSVAAPDGFGYTGPGPAASRSSGFATASLALSPGSATAVAADVVVDADGAVVTGATVAARIGPADLWAGRKSARLGPTTAPGLVLDGLVAFDGVGFDTPLGFGLPGFLDALGTVRLGQVVARLDRSGDIDDPWFFATRITFAPGRSWAVGLNRAALFGGTGNEAVTPRRLLLLLAGITDTDGKDSDFENQVASIDVVVRPAAFWVLYAEFAADDWGLGFARVPAVTVGAEHAALAGGALAAGVEVTGIAGSCCTYPAWYRHGALADGWSDRGRLLGHPLAGHGLQASMTWRVLPVNPAMLAAGRFYVRHRGAENLFAPDRAGRSIGLEARASIDLPDRFRIELETDAERGTGWDRWSGRVAVGYTF